MGGRSYGTADRPRRAVQRLRPFSVVALSGAGFVLLGVAAIFSSSQLSIVQHSLFMDTPVSPEVTAQRKRIRMARAAFQHASAAERDALGTQLQRLQNDLHPMVVAANNAALLQSRERARQTDDFRQSLSQASKQVYSRRPDDPVTQRQAADFTHVATYLPSASAAAASPTFAVSSRHHIVPEPLGAADSSSLLMQNLALHLSPERPDSDARPIVDREISPEVTQARAEIAMLRGKYQAAPRGPEREAVKIELTKAMEALPPLIRATKEKQLAERRAAPLGYSAPSDGMGSASLMSMGPAAIEAAPSMTPTASPSAVGYATRSDGVRSSISMSMGPPSMAPPSITPSSVTEELAGDEDTFNTALTRATAAPAAATGSKEVDAASSSPMPVSITPLETEPPTTRADSAMEQGYGGGIEQPLNAGVESSGLRADETGLQVGAKEQDISDVLAADTHTSAAEDLATFSTAPDRPLPGASEALPPQIEMPLLDDGTPIPASEMVPMPAPEGAKQHLSTPLQVAAKEELLVPFEAAAKEDPSMPLEVAANED